MEKVTLISKKDLVITWFNGGKGHGGSNRNAHNNCCRIYHPESGAEGIGTKERSSHQNQKLAFKALCEHPKMKVWLSRKLYDLQTGKTVEERVEEAMATRNLKIEGIDDSGQWVEIEVN